MITLGLLLVAGVAGGWVCGRHDRSPRPARTGPPPARARVRVHRVVARPYDWAADDTGLDAG